MGEVLVMKEVLEFEVNQFLRQLDLLCKWHASEIPAAPLLA
jgi:hypothetical protein